MISASTIVRHSLLRAQIGARQEDHADGKPVGLRLVPGCGDGIVEKADGRSTCMPRTVAGLAIGIDRAAVPHSLQRLDRRRDHAPRRPAIGRRDQPDPAGIALGFGIVHAFAGKAFMFGGGENRLVGHAATFSLS
jgi:hypothetical protein